MSIKLIENVTQLMQPRNPEQFLAMYNSRLDAIITNPSFMTISIKEQLCNLCGVFDTTNVSNGTVFCLDAHIDRLIRSAERARFTITQTKEQIVDIAEQVMAVVDASSYKLRFFISPDQNSLTDDVVHTWSDTGLFILAFRDKSFAKPQSVREYTVDLPLKPFALTMIKSNNYILNAMTAMDSKAKGGYQGIPIDEEGYIYESAMANLAIVSKGRFITPPDENILIGTTLSLVLKQLDLDDSIEVVRRKVHVQEAYKASEMMLLGGDACVAVTHLDDVQIGDG